LKIKKTPPKFSISCFAYRHKQTDRSIVPWAALASPLPPKEV